jgi:hypothetical protein
MSENPSSNPKRCAAGMEVRGLPMVGLILMLIYQGILVLFTFYFVVSFGSHDYLPVDVLIWVYVLICWGAAMTYASIGMIMRSPPAFLVGMICHALLEMIGIVLACLYSMAAVAMHKTLDLAVALMWLPFLLISGWGFFFLGSLRKRLLT